MGIGKTVSMSRRAVWSRAPSDTSPPLPPPWTDAATLAAACTRCGGCAQSCPQHIIVTGESGLPAIDFRRGECTFCGACADVCPAPVFDRKRESPWTVTARVNAACLAARGVVCQSCRDACPTNAIQFRARLGGAFLPGIMSERCTGCGACVGVCPTDAIDIVEPAHAG
jgi:ferredoxin-type protein NapF